MRKTRITVLIASLLATVMLLSSCSLFGGSIKFEKFADGSLYKDTPAYAAAAAVADLANADFETAQGDLILLEKEEKVGEEEYTKYIVYNLATGAVVYTVTETKTTQVQIQLGECNDAAYFTVYTATFTLDENQEVDYSKDPDVVADLYAGKDGAKIATAARMVQVEKAYDLLRFDGKCYRAAEDGTIAYAFDYSAMADMPEIDTATENYYYALGGEEFAIYDKNLAQVAYYAAPSYVDIEGYILLDNDKVFLQGFWSADPYTEDYDVLSYDGEKLNMLTALLDGKKGEIKEIECDYAVMDGYTDKEDLEEECFNAEKLANLVWILPIENKRMNDSRSAVKMATVTEKGKIKILEDVTPFPTLEIECAGANRWIAEDADRRDFLINEKAEILGEITNRTDRNESYILADGKLYDYSLNMVYDYEAAKLSVKKVLDESILFTDKDGALISYANGAATTLIAKEALLTRNYVNSMSGSDYYVISDSTDPAAIKYEIYNEAGAKILTVDYNAESFGISRVASTGEGVALLCVTGWDITNLESTYAYYRLG